jgi:eight-cysteine-cluster-containing protein
MNKFFSNFILISCALIMSASFAFYLNHLTKTSRDRYKKDSQIQLRQILKDEDGGLLFSSGTCGDDSDCFAAGCSSHYCSSNPDIVTTCEYSKDYPSEEIYKCGCFEEKCAWYTD